MGILQAVRTGNSTCYELPGSRGDSEGTKLKNLSYLETKSFPLLKDSVRYVLLAPERRLIFNILLLRLSALDGPHSVVDSFIAINCSLASWLSGFTG